MYISTNKTFNYGTTTTRNYDDLMKSRTRSVIRRSATRSCMDAETLLMKEVGVAR